MRTSYADVNYGPFNTKQPCGCCGEPNEQWALYECPEGWCCGSCLTDAVRPPEEQPSLSWRDVRARRFQMLAATDWTQLPDVPDATKEEAQALRQMLRDVTDYATPEEAWSALDSLGAK